VSARLVGEGYEERAVDVDIEPHSTATFEVTPNPTCRTSMYQEQAEDLQVRARTSRGDLVTRTLTLPEEVADWLGHLERDRCGFLRPDEALVSDVVSTRTRHGDVVVTLRLLNTGEEPLTVSKLSTFGGIEPRARLPLHLGGRGDSTGATRTLEVVLHVSSCKALARLAAQLGSSPEELLPPFVLATVSNRYASAVATFPILSFDDDEPGDDFGSGGPLFGSCSER
jgi:hypothetical protein